MKFRKSLITLGLATAMAAPAAFAGAPTGTTLGAFSYDATLATGIEGSGITLNGTGGVGVAGCDVGYTCSSSVVSDSGFLQVQMTEDSSGKTYFRTIVADDGATAMMGNLRSDSFVGTQSTGTTGGVAAYQNIEAGMGGVGANGNGLSSTATLLTGAFDGAGESYADISQTVWDNTGNAGDGTEELFDTGFNFTKADETSAMGMTSVTSSISDAAAGFDADFGVAMRMVMGTGMVMDVTVDQSIDNSTDVDEAFLDTFRMASTVVEADGSVIAKVVDADNSMQLIETGTANLGDGTFNYSLRQGTPDGGAAAGVFDGWTGVTADTATLGANTVDWVAGDTIAQVLIGQDTGESLFGFESINDMADIDPTVGVDDTVGMEEFSSLTSTGPFATYTTGPSPF